jgi:hypothetical protein
MNVANRLEIGSQLTLFHKADIPSALPLKNNLN